MASAKVSRANARLVDQQIADAFWRGNRERGQIVQEGLSVAGRQRVGAGAVNLDLSFGSPLDAVYNTRLGMQRDIRTAEKNTEGEARDLTRQRGNFLAEAAASEASAAHAGRSAGNTDKNARRAGKNARTAGTIRTIADAASGGNELYKAWIAR